MNFQEMLQNMPIIAILRGIRPEEIVPVGQILREAGIRLLEVPLNTPEALTGIRLAAQQFHREGGMLVGAGTVLSGAAVRDVVAAGGKFIISPDTQPEVIRTARECGVISIPGVFTPTEALTALRAGAHYLKLFPAGRLGPEYIRDLKAVISAPILAVGGVNAENLPDFLKLSAGVGIGSALYKPGKTLDEIRRSAQLFSEIAHVFN